MPLTTAQLKGKIKCLAEKTKSDARLLIRIYMMDRFLERLALSQYKNNFIIKGGILITSLLGVSLRSTMDIDASIKNISLNVDNLIEIVTEVSKIPLDDGVSFNIKRAENIMEGFDYPGVRIDIDCIMGKMITPIKLDISTGDVITPSEVRYSYKLIIDGKDIDLFTYNIETILAEKLQTILTRGTLNTRMRDFYDVYALIKMHKENINSKILRDAFIATSQHRLSKFDNISERIIIIANDDTMNNLWAQYQSKYSYASEIKFEEIITCLNLLTDKILENGNNPDGE